MRCATCGIEAGISVGTNWALTKPDKLTLCISCFDKRTQQILEDPRAVAIALGFVYIPEPRIFRNEEALKAVRAAALVKARAARQQKLADMKAEDARFEAQNPSIDKITKNTKAPEAIPA